MNKNLPEIAKQIADIIGCGILPGGDEYRQQFAGGPVPFGIYSLSGTDKLRVSITFPRTADGTIISDRDLYPTPDDCSIKFSAGRKPEVIAADIKRRFFPVAKLVYAACLERVKSADVYGTVCEHNAKRIEILFSDAKLRQETPNSHATVDFTTSQLHGFAKVCRDDITVTLRGNAADIINALTRFCN